MSGRQGELLERPKRKTRGQLMHVSDAGYGGSSHGVNVQFQCAKCEYMSGWMECETVTEAKRGLPCPKCNGDDQ